MFLVPDVKRGYVPMTVGKNGQAFAGEELEIALFRRSRCVTATVSTNADGLFELGKLPGVTSVCVKLANSAGLQITSVKPAKDGDDVEVQLSGANERTHVHVVLSSLLPAYTTYQLLCAPMRFPDVVDFVTLPQAVNVALRGERAVAQAAGLDAGHLQAPLRVGARGALRGGVSPRQTRTAAKTRGS